MNNTFVVLIIFQLLFVMEVSIDINSTKNNMKIVSVTEILLQTPMLNIIIVNAKIDHNDVNYVEHNSGMSMACILFVIYGSIHN